MCNTIIILNKVVYVASVAVSSATTTGVVLVVSVGVTVSDGAVCTHKSDNFKYLFKKSYWCSSNAS